MESIYVSTICSKRRPHTTRMSCLLPNEIDRNAFVYVTITIEITMTWTAHDDTLPVYSEIKDCFACRRNTKIDTQIKQTLNFEKHEKACIVYRILINAYRLKYTTVDESPFGRSYTDNKSNRYRFEN